MRDEKLLKKGERDLLHFLGTSKLDWAVALTAVKRDYVTLLTRILK